ncbi:MAG: DNA-3-methyladenine glycosylase 2 family protein [Chloroflexi bacterium]|nr:DNA-3-methyladenine glycosylase 2 family protein [Chloroflexota bacterium]
MTLISGTAPGTLQPPDSSSTFSIDGRLNLRETLSGARLGPMDPSIKFLDGAFWRATRTPLGLATERLEVQPDGRIRVDAWGPGSDVLVERAPALCGAFDDPSSFVPCVPFVRELARRHAGLRIGRNQAVFETAIGVAVEQRVATQDAWRSWRGLVYSLGEPAPGPPRGLRVPPAPERLAATPFHTFRRFGIDERRATIIKRLAIVAHRLEHAQQLPLAEAYARLRTIPGVGPWTAARIGLIALGDADAVLVGDLHVPHLVTRVLAGERRGSDERMLELLEPFRGHRGRVIRLLMAGTMTRTRREFSTRRLFGSKYSRVLPLE